MRTRATEKVGLVPGFEKGVLLHIGKGYASQVEAGAHQKIWRWTCPWLPWRKTESEVIRPRLYS